MGKTIPDNEVAVVITPQSAPALLASLRWEADTIVTNHAGERIWLCHARDEAGGIVGLTDCCLESDPCRVHALRGALNTLGDVRADMNVRHG